MSALQAPQHSTVQAIYRLHEAREAAAGGHRPHLGASVIGHPCERHLWLHFRWAGQEALDGRMLRLFQYGHHLEGRLVAELRACGIEVHDTDGLGQQWRVQALGGHFGGSLDGAALGLPEAPATWHLLEFKSSNDKLFTVLQAQGVEQAKPMHWAQMQVYMGLTGLTRALYLVENKNTSALYEERVAADPVAFARLMARAQSVVEAAEPPPRLSNDPAWWQCKFCAFHGLCHGSAGAGDGGGGSSMGTPLQAPEVNCRTCAHSTPRTDQGSASTGSGGPWVCERKRAPLDLPAQRRGCDGHRFIPLLLERLGTQAGVSEEPDGNATVSYRTPDGRSFSNGAAPALSSAEIAINPAACADPMVQALKATFPTARVVA